MAKKRYLSLEDHAVAPCHGKAFSYCPSTQPRDTADLQALKNADAFGRQLAQEMFKAADAAQALESIAHYLTTQVKDEPLGVEASHFLNLAVESICLEANFEPGAHALSLESYAHSPVVAMEGALAQITEKIKDIYKFIKTKLVDFFKLLAEKMDHYKRNMGNLTRKVKALEALVLRIEPSSVPGTPALKPGWWAINLLYLQKGFPQHAKGVSDDVANILSAHAGLFTKTIAEQVRWLKANHQAVMQDVRALNTFKVRRDDFLLLNAKEMSRSIRDNVPMHGNMFYRSEELPGGKAFFTEIQPHDQYGVLAIDMLANVSVSIEEYDPVSYDMRELQIAAQMQAEMQEWYYSLPAEQREGRGGVPDFSQDIERLPGTGREVRIEPSMVFEVLPVIEAKRRLAEVKDNLRNIEAWYHVVFGDIWKDQDFDYLASELTQERNAQSGGAVYANPAPRHLGNLVMALMAVMGNATEYTHHYAFEVSESMLEYVEQSLRQYPAS